MRRHTRSLLAGARSVQSGLSLIELMVALVIGLILTAGIIQLFVGSKQTYRFQEALSRLQENGRFATETLNYDVRMAGNMGCARNLQRETPPGTGILASGFFRVTLNNSGDYQWAFDSGLQGYQWNGNGWTPAIPAGALATVPLGGSDVITVRGVVGAPVTVVNHPGGTPPGSSVIGVNVGNGFSGEDIMIVGDCSSAAVFQISVSASNPNGPDTSGSLPHSSAGGFTPGNFTPALGREFAGADVMRVATRTYYIDTGQSGRPALFRRVNLDAAEELVEGVERMQFLYGVDTNGDRIADPHAAGNAYWTGAQVEAANRWGDVVSLRASLLLQSVDNNVTDTPQSIGFEGTVMNTGPGADARLRQVFATTIAVRNRLP